MHILPPLDVAALAFFLLAWGGYAIAVEWGPGSNTGLNSRMHAYRDIWMRRALHRELRMFDAQIMAALQNGTAFFASTSLLAIGGGLTMLRATNEIQTVIENLQVGEAPSSAKWEIKAAGLILILVYAFFKFAWAYRLYNYVAIMLGAMPPATERTTAGSRTPCAAHDQALRIGGPALQPRPAGVLLRPRLPRLVRRAVAAHGVDHRHRHRDVAAPVRVRRPARAHRGAGGGVGTGSRRDPGKGAGKGPGRSADDFPVRR